MLNDIIMNLVKNVHRNTQQFTLILLELDWYVTSNDGVFMASTYS